MSRLCNGVSGDQPYVRESRAYCEGRQFAVETGTIVYATAATGDEQDDNALTWTAATVGDGLVVRLLDPGEADQALAVSVAGLQVDVSLETDQAGDIASTAAEVTAAVAGDADAAALVAATDTGASAGTGVVEADEVRLTGGSYDAVQDSQDALCWERGFDSYNGGQGTLNAQDCCPYPSYTAVG